MRVVWKYTLEVTAHNEVRIPKGGKVIHVGTQFEKPTIWVLVDPHAPTELRRFCIATTGQYFDDKECAYLGTFMLGGGVFVGHVVEPPENVAQP